MAKIPAQRTIDDLVALTELDAPEVPITMSHVWGKHSRHLGTAVLG